MHLVELEADGDQVELTAPGGAAAIYGHAAPIGEPVAADGPFVMNTVEELRQAVSDWHAGRFGTVPG
jgi:redox-sensitive bicupin YhaK (pirin superfamily)